MIDLIRRQIELLKLLSKQREYKPASFFSKSLDVSTKTIYTDITYLQSEVEKYKVDLVRAPRIGIRLEGEKENIQHMLRDLQKDNLSEDEKYTPEYRRLWILKKVLIDCETITLESVSKEFLVSKTSLYQDIAVINKSIESQSDVKLEVGECGICILGEEIEIQNAVNNYLLSESKEEMFSDFTHKLGNFFELDVIKAVSDLILNDFEELTEVLSEYYLKSLLVTLIMQSSRLLKKKHMNEETEISYNNIRYMETYIVANSIAEQLKCQLHITYSNNDMEYLCRQLYAHRVTHHVKHMRTDYEETVRDVIKRMSEIQKLDLTRDKKLYESLLYHLPPMILRLQNNIQIVNPMLDNIKQEYPELFTTIWYALTQIELRYQVTLTEDEVSLILLHFQVALDQFEQVGNIVVVCTYGVSSSQLILSRVKQILPAKDNITVTTTKKLKEIDPSKVDLIISSVDIEDPEISYVKVNPLLTKDDYANILDAYTKQVLLIKNNVCDNQKNGIKAPTLKKYLEGKFIFLKQDLDSKEKCLDFIIDVLEKDNAVYDEFREAIYKREKLGVTCLDTGVALPHADPQTIKKSRIILLTLKHPVDWGGTLVSLIVVTAFPEEEMNQIRDVINELYQLIGEKEDVNTFIRFETIQEVLKVFHES